MNERSMNDRFSRTKEEITSALIREYVKQHPGIEEQQVVMLCKEGKLLFSDIATVMAEMKVNQNFELTMERSAKMVANLAIQENERWEDCCASTEHSRLILDCLNSSTFSCIDTLTWREGYNQLEREERDCAKITIYLEASKEKMAIIKEDEVEGLRSRKGKMILIEYLNNVISQLKVLHRALKKELELGTTFEKKAVEFIEVTFSRLERRPVPFKLETKNFNKVFSTLKNNDKSKIFDKEILDFNRDLLLETKNSLNSAVDELKSHNEKRREQFHQVWDTIVSIENTVKEIQVLDDQPNTPKESSYRTRHT